MERKEIMRRPGARHAALDFVPALLIGGGAGWDALRLAGSAVDPRVSWALVAGGVAAGCAAVLARVFGRHSRGRNAAELAVLGVVLLAWWVRGSAAVPADPPLVAAEAAGALLLAVLAVVARRRVSGSSPRGRSEMAS